MGSLGLTKTQYTRVPTTYVVGDLTQSDIEEFAQQLIDTNDTEITHSIILAVIYGSNIQENYTADEYDAVESILKNYIDKHKPKQDTYTSGGTTYEIITKNGKPYLKLTTGKLVNSYKIAYAKNVDKAYITVPYIGQIKFSSEQGIANLLDAYNKK